MTVHIVAILTARPGARAAILAAFTDNLPHVLAEQGCLKYVPVIDHDASDAPLGPDTVVVIEEWESHADLQAHAVAAHMLRFRERIADHLADRSVHVLSAA